LLIAPVMASFSCASGNIGTATSCWGEFRLDAVERSLRRDAFETIVQFTQLDPNVEAVQPFSPRQDRLAITGRGEQCDIFGRSFLASDMPEFRGLAYRPGRELH
jgi:hypothetical protein